MKLVWLFALLVGCTVAPHVPKPVAERLTYCELTTHKPTPLPSIVTKEDLLSSYQTLTIFIKELEQCLKQKQLRLVFRSSQR